MEYHENIKLSTRNSEEYSGHEKLQVFVWDFPTLCQERRYFFLYLFVYQSRGFVRDPGNQCSCVRYSVRQILLVTAKNNHHLLVHFMTHTWRHFQVRIWRLIQTATQSQESQPHFPQIFPSVHESEFSEKNNNQGLCSFSQFLPKNIRRRQSTCSAPVTSSAGCVGSAVHPSVTDLVELGCSLWLFKIY